MKSLKDYLIENKKTYPFKIGVAGDLPEHFESKLKMALEKYSIAKFNKTKKTPIQDRPLDFPNLQNTEVTFFEVEIHYPTTDAILQEYLGSLCDVPRSHIIVRNPNSPIEEVNDTSESEVYTPLLTQNDLGGTSAQQSVGQNRVMDLLKELENSRKDRTDSGFKLETTEEPHNTKSVVGN